MTIKEIAQSISLPESTIRLYRDEFADFLLANGEGRRRRYDQTALETMRQIVALKKAGASSTTIRQELGRTHTPQQRKQVQTQEERTAGIAMTLTAQQGEIALLRAEVGALRSEIGRLISLLGKERDGGPTMETIQKTRTAS